MTKKSLFLTFALVAAGCGAVDSSDDELSEDQITAVAGKADNLGLPVPGDTAGRLYFDADQTFYLNDVTPLDYHVFTARGGQAFDLSITATNDEGDVIDTSAAIGFKLYRLARTYSGKLYWKLVTSVDGVQGEASQAFISTVARYYMVESAGGPAHILLHLGCNGAAHSKCALGGQPGDGCKSNGKCDTGLYCLYAQGACNAKTTPGVCTVQPQSCPRLGLACFPVCGCDGKTYCQGCDLTNHGVSIAHQGQCGCDATVFTPGNISTGSSSWLYIDPATNDHYGYTFAGKNGVTSEHDAGCLFATPIHCNIAIAPKHGTYSYASPSQIVITYDDGTTAAFDGLTNCQGDNRLTGTDYGRSLTLAPQ